MRVTTLTFDRVVLRITLRHVKYSVIKVKKKVSFSVPVQNNLTMDYHKRELVFLFGLPFPPFSLFKMFLSFPIGINLFGFPQHFYFHFTINHILSRPWIFGVCLNAKVIH